jgi:hypothetical protein
MQSIPKLYGRSLSPWGMLTSWRAFARHFVEETSNRTVIYFHCGGLDFFPRPPALPSISFKALCTRHVGGTHYSVGSAKDFSHPWLEF